VGDDSKKLFYIADAVSNPESYDGVKIGENRIAFNEIVDKFLNDYDSLKIRICFLSRL
jgi:hypothetical protein